MHGIGVENLRGSGMIAGETSRAYDETFTLSYVTGAPSLCCVCIRTRMHIPHVCVHVMSTSPHPPHPPPLSSPHQPPNP